MSRDLRAENQRLEAEVRRLNADLSTVLDLVDGCMKRVEERDKVISDLGFKLERERRERRLVQS